MNYWTCQHPDCKRSAIGVGGAFGLQAIGWYFVPGQYMSGLTLFCPVHRPDGIECTVGEGGPECGLCKAELEAKRFQVAAGAETW